MPQSISCASVILLACAAAQAWTAPPRSEPRSVHGTVHVLAPERIRDFLPSSLGDLSRGDIAAERVTALGVPISQAEAQYRDDGGQYITLRIEDTGGATGLKSLVPWASAGRRVHEKWEPSAAPNGIGYGEYALVVRHRYLVEASGQVSGMSVLESAVRSVDVKKLESAQSKGRGRANREPTAR